MKIFVIDFSDTNFIANSLKKGHKVFVEKHDGGNAYKQVGEIMPEKIFINYHDKPGHGRETAKAIRKRKKTSGIPIYFVDGNEKDNNKVKLIGKTIKINEIENSLSG